MHVTQSKVLAHLPPGVVAGQTDLGTDRAIAELESATALGTFWPVETLGHIFWEHSLVWIWLRGRYSGSAEGTEMGTLFNLRMLVEGRPW